MIVYTKHIDVGENVNNRLSILVHELKQNYMVVYNFEEDISFKQTKITY